MTLSTPPARPQAPAETAASGDDALCYLTASEALERFKARQLSPVELLAAVRRRVERVNGPINALRSTRWDSALEAARAAEQRYASGSGLGALDGVPTLLKNEHALIGEETDQGSLLFAGRIDDHNAPITQRLLDAGAVIHARTQVPEFYVANFTRSVAHGVTRNPYRLSVTCGGSSGGSGAALAAGLGLLSSASDIGGSIRMPSAYCGVVGLKASYGRVPEANIEFALNPFNHNGVMARSVADAALMFNVVNGPHPADPSTLRPKLELPVPRADVRGLRIAISPDLGYFDVTDEIRAQLDRVASMLRDAGAQVETVDLAWDARVGKAYTDALVFPLGRGLAALAADAAPGTVSDYVLSMARQSASITVDDYLASIYAIGEMNQALQDVYARYDVLVCPTLARNDLPAEGMADAHAVFLQQSMTYPFNMLSRHPVLAVPAGRGAQGVPIGVQVVGQTFCEETAMRVGAVLERAVGWLDWRPTFA